MVDTMPYTPEEIDESIRRKARSRSNLWWIFDLDGTLCDHDHRVSHILRARESGLRPDYDAYHSACIFDPIRKPEVTILNSIQMWSNHRTALCTGRPEKFKKLTEDWLEENGIEYDVLAMRPIGDYLSSAEFKRDWYLNDFKIHYPDSVVMGVFEDRKSVVDMWRSLGLTCFQTQDVPT
ncbi:MAG: hypothetical protein WDA12_04870 [Bacilli bacterium]